MKEMMANFLITFYEGRKTLTPKLTIVTPKGGNHIVNIDAKTLNEILAVIQKTNIL